MIPKELLTDLIEELDQYCSNSTNALNLEAFVHFMYSNSLKKSAPMVRKMGGDYAQGYERDFAAESMGKLIGVLNRYAKHYLKLAFDNTLIQTAEEFTFLMVLFTHEKMLQSELIKQNVMEKATGNEIIKRLMRLGLIVEAEKVEDKRAKPIALSALGRQEVLKALPQMRKVGQLLGGNLSTEEQALLVHLLSKLDHYHHELYHQKGIQELEDYLHYFSKS